MPGTRLHSLTIRKLGRVQNSLQTLRLEGLDSGKVVRGREMACRHFTQESSHTFPLLQLGHCLEQNLLLHQVVLNLSSLSPLPVHGKTKCSKSCAKTCCSAGHRDGGDGKGQGSGAK